MFLGNNTFPSTSITYGIAFDSLLAIKSGFLSIGGTYNGASDLRKIYELNCNGEGGCLEGMTILEYIHCKKIPIFG